MAAKTNAKPDPATTLRLSADSKERNKLLGKIVTDPVVSNAFAARKFSCIASDVDLTTHVESLRRQCEAVHKGDLKHSEAVLVSQAHTLDAIFTQFAHRAALNVGHYPETVDAYMRLALRAQSQCRATLETLATIKNPPIVFAKQANIAHGHQQVNNGDAAPVARGQTDNRPTELLEHADESQRLDIGTAAAASAGNPPLAAVEAIHRPAHAKRKGRIKP